MDDGTICESGGVGNAACGGSVGSLAGAAHNLSTGYFLHLTFDEALKKLNG